jgi:hypothetical protein
MDKADQLKKSYDVTIDKGYGNTWDEGCGNTWFYIFGEKGKRTKEF